MVTWKIFFGYILLLLLILVCHTASAQIVVTHYNAEWNKANDVEWLKKLEDCDITKVDIVKHTKLQKKHGIVIVPTIIIFNNGNEVKRFQADISFKMVATRKEVQEEIDNLIMNNSFKQTGVTSCLVKSCPDCMK